MPVIDVRKDPAELTLTIVSEYDHAVEKVWSLWSDPRKLEKWWGPPTHPATFTQHELVAGGQARYYMTSPEGEQYHGMWRLVSVSPPQGLEAEDFFTDADGNANTDLPSSYMIVSLAQRPSGGTRMSVTGRFASAESMEQLIAMGMQEGLTLALGQADALLA